MLTSLLAAAERLAGVLERENVALGAMDLARAAALVADKTAALADLTACGEARVGPRDADLASAAQRLDALAEENRRLLRRAMAAQQRVIGIVAGAAVSAIRQPFYGARGQTPPITVPMTLSTRA